MTKKLVSVAVTALMLCGVVLALPVNASAGNKFGCAKRSPRLSMPWSNGGWNNHNNDWDDENEGNTEVHQDNDTVVVSISNDADVDSHTSAWAITGGNHQGHNDDNNHMTTGEAHASASSWNVVNSTTVEINQN